MRLTLVVGFGVAAALLTGCDAVIAPVIDVPQQQQAPTRVDRPTGFFDSIDGKGVARGWSLLGTDGSQYFEVALFLDGDATTGAPLGSTVATDPRPDVNASRGVDGNHGFSFSIPEAAWDGVEHQVHAFVVTAGEKLELGGSPRSFKLRRHCLTAGPKVAPTDSEYVLALEAVNGKFVSADCGGDDVGLLTADQDAIGEFETFYVKVEPNAHLSIRSSHGRSLSAEGGGGDALVANRTAVGPWELFTHDGFLGDGSMLGLLAVDGQHWVTARLDWDPIKVAATAGALGPWERFKVHMIHSPVHLRPGVVRGDGRNFVDGEGAFYPLGGTLFWSLWGWKNDRDRLKANLEYLKANQFDYVRILGEVDWPGEEIDPAWADYQQVLGEFIDYAYDQCGLRTELSLVGGKGDPMVLAQKVAPVINANRQHKILDLEVANESYGRPISLQQMQDAGRWLRQNTQNLVALSSGEGLGSYVATINDWRADYVATYMPADAASLGTIHMDRTYGDDGWRTSRQPWDWKDFNFPISHNEPVGPRSSVAEDPEPLHLAMVRAVGIINGVGAFILHNGAGVAGKVDPAHNRPANLWEVPGIDEVMRTVRGLDAWLPQRAGDGTHWNNAWAGNPFVADAFWSDGANHGVNRNYTVSTPDGWISTEAGIKDFVVFTVSRNSRVEVFDLLKGKVKEVVLTAGQTLTLNPESKDGKGYGALVIVGHYN